MMFNLKDKTKYKELGNRTLKEYSEYTYKVQTEYSDKLCTEALYNAFTTNDK